MNITNNSLSVKQLNLYVKSLLESDRNLKSIVVKGEISNYVRHSKSGHVYFTLKDDEASVKTVMFNTAADTMDFKPEDGMTVIVYGRVSLYERDGQYQLYAVRMIQAGLGVLHMAFLRLKEKLEKEGLFAEANKKPLPAYPQTIGLVTSPTGAAIKDFLSVMQRRYPQVRIILYPCNVQGIEAPQSVIKAVEYFNKKEKPDVIVITRGGGSIEDLSAFNDEQLARAVYASKVPVVSAIGHEIDFTILDFVADKRAPTPSVAAEIISPNREDMIFYLQRIKSNITNRMKSKVEVEKQKVFFYEKNININSLIEKNQIYIDNLYVKLCSLTVSKYKNEESRLGLYMGKIQALSPLNVLQRGYSLAYKQNEIIKSVDNINIGENFILKLKDGEVDCVANEIKKGKRT